MRNSVALRDGTVAHDPRLGRLIQFDERSRSFPIRALVSDKKPRSYTWSISRVLDQGNDGACVGFSLSHELLARPAVTLGIDYKFAMKVYKDAQKIDPWEGEDYEGTSVLAGVKSLQDRGYYKEYRWAFSLQDTVLAIGYAGPVVFGVWWFENMFYPDENGFIVPTGMKAGGHAILGNAVRLVFNGKGRTWQDVNLDKSYVTLTNSWGDGWGVNGTCKVTLSNLRKLLDDDGETCIPLGRSTKEKV